MGITTDPNDPRLTRGVDDQQVPQAKAYLVLSEEERAKGFVRPYRDTYKHVGIRICGKPISWSNNPDNICAGKPDHAGSCDDQGIATTREAAGDRKGCGTFTTMRREIAETYARDNKFYGATYCVHCQKHLPLIEFVWFPDGLPVGQ